MMPAFRNFILLSSALIIGIVLVWFTLRLSGNTQSIAPPMAHGFLPTQPNDIVAYHPSGVGTTIDRLAGIAQLSSQIVLWLDVRPESDGSLVATAGDEGNSEGQPSIAAGDATPLDTALSRLAKNRLILNFRGNREGMIQALAGAIEKAHAGDRVLVQSPEDGFLKSLREGKPEWLYGTSSAALTLFVMLSSIGLESITPLKADVLVVESHLKDHNLDRFSDDMIKEAHRRRMKIYAGPVVRFEDALTLWHRHVDGVLTPEPEQLWNLTHKP